MRGPDVISDTVMFLILWCTLTVNVSLQW